MGAKRINKVTVVTGEYQKDGETKKSRELVGYEMQDDAGNRFIRLKRSFNPSGVPFREGDDTIVLGVWPLDDSPSQQRGGQSQRQAPAQQPRQADDDFFPF